MQIRSAREVDLLPAARIYQDAARALGERIRAFDPMASESARDRDLREAVRVLTDLCRRRDGAVVVAEIGNDLAGVGAVRVQDEHAHIAFLFVQPGFQERGLGRQILDRLSTFATNAGARTTTLIASRDPRAWQRYLRLGLRPGLPILSMRATKPLVPAAAPDTGWRVERLRPDSSAHLDLIDGMDLAVRGSRRRSDVESWVHSGDTGALLIDPASRAPIGYAIIAGEPDHIRIGPVVSMSTDHVPGVLAHALHLAGTRDGVTRHPWRIDLSSANQVAVGPLLEAGFVVTALQPWFASGKVGQWDRYVFRTEDEL